MAASLLSAAAAALAAMLSSVYPRVSSRYAMPTAPEAESSFISVAWKPS
jgi:hypothetical protein